MKNKNKAVVFDFDGVIADTFEFHRQKIEEYLGLKLSEKDYRMIHTGNIHDNRIVNNYDWTGYPQFVESGFYDINIFNDMYSIVKKLCQKMNIFIISSGRYKNINIFLEKERLKQCFKEVLGVEFHKSKVVKFNHLLKKI